MSKSRSLIESFSYAFSGLRTIIKNEPNIRIHFIIALFAILAGIFLGLSKIDWVILLFTTFFVLILEFVNTALEALVDIVSPQTQEKARVAKDVSASAVFLSALLSVIIGLFIFLPKILQFIAKLE